MEGYYGEGRNWLEATLVKDESTSGQARAMALEGVGWLALQQGDVDRAEAAAEEGLKLSAEAGLGEAVVADFQNIMGDAARHRGDYERAADLIEASLALHRKAMDIVGVAWSLGDLANVLGDQERATTLNEEATELYQKRGRRGGLQYAFDNLGWAALARGDHKRAKTLHEENLVLCRELGDKLIASESMEGLACVAEVTGEVERA